VFVSYSHKNGRLLERLLVHLKPLERSKQIDVWSDMRLKVGDDWRHEIEVALDRAQVAILLVSADFLASDFITRVELPSLLQAAAKRKCKVMPIIVGPCGFSSDSELAALPSDKLAWQAIRWNEKKSSGGDSRESRICNSGSLV
jgi:hypothetical protein